MLILIDYDNIAKLEKQRGIENIIHKILNKLGANVLVGSSRASVRLYGGWYQGNNLTNLAQKIRMECGSFPKIMSVPNIPTPVQIHTHVDLAFSLLIEPTLILQNTYRTNEIPKGLRSLPSPYYKCGNSTSCRIAHIHDFIANEACMENGCQVDISKVLVRDEQKLVDSMIVADLIYHAENTKQDVCVVSSDDDIWTGIRSALLYGSRVFHIQTHSGRITPQYYTRTTKAGYQTLSL